MLIGVKKEQVKCGVISFCVETLKNFKDLQRLARLYKAL